MVADSGFIDIVFDGPPSHEGGRFVEVENDKRQSIKVGDWIHRDDGYWVLRIAESRLTARNILQAVVGLGQPNVADYGERAARNLTDSSETLPGNGDK